MNNRLYCGDVTNLNDIREADVRAGNDQRRETEIIDIGTKVQELLRGKRVFALCRTFDSHLLLAYHAGGSSGIAIEVDLPDEDVVEVRYGDDFAFLADHADPANLEPLIAAVLSHKYSDWRHEQEIRIISESTFYAIPEPISRILVGSRVKQTTIDALAILCEPLAIRVDRVVVADWGLYTLGAQVFNTGRQLKPRKTKAQQDVAPNA